MLPSNICALVAITYFERTYVSAIGGAGVRVGHGAEPVPAGTGGPLRRSLRHPANQVIKRMNVNAKRPHTW